MDVVRVGEVADSDFLIPIAGDHESIISSHYLQGMEMGNSQSICGESVK